MQQASPPLIWSFAALAVVVGAMLPLGLAHSHRRLGPEGGSGRAAALGALGVIVWMGVTLAAAAAGVVRFDATPPTALVLIAVGLALGVWLGVSPAGRRLALGLPLYALVGAQAFRLPLELIMHRAYAEGVMPVQMSYSGRNFDIVTGATAILVAGLLFVGRMPLWGVRVWNWMGAALLLNIVTIAILSAPTPLRVFMNEPANVWVTRPPFIWLPTVMVVAALLGHILVLRRVRAEREGV